MAFDGDVQAELHAVFVPAGAESPAESSLLPFMQLIRKYFASRVSVESIVDALQVDLRHDGPQAEQAWLRDTLTALTLYSPTMLVVTREALLRGREMSLAECFRMELDIVSHALEDGDFHEGVRAHLIDKDRHPRWVPGTLAEMTPERIQWFFASSWPSEAHPLVGLMDK